METIVLFLILLFFIIFLSVRLAIHPLLYKPDEILSKTSDLGLIKLRDMEVLSNDELEEVIELYRNWGLKKGYGEQFHKYEKVINDLKEMGYLTNEQYSDKIMRLKKYFKILNN